VPRRDGRDAGGRRVPSGWPLALAALICLAAAAAPAGAQDGHGDGTSLEEIEEKAEERRSRAEELEEKARDLSEQARGLKAKSVATARRIQDLERELTDIEETLAALESERRTKRRELKRRRGQLAETLAALQRIAVLPPEALAVARASPLEIVRSGKLLQVAVPEIERRATELKAEIAKLRQLTQEIGQQRQQLRKTAERLSHERTELEALAERKREARQQVAARSERAAEDARALAERAANMRELMEELRGQEKAREAAMARRRAEQRTPTPATKPPPAGSTDAAKPPEKPQTPETAKNAGNAKNAGKAGSAAPSESQVARRTPADRPSAKSDGARTQARLDRPGDIRDFPDRRSSLTVPAAGRIVTRYGERRDRAGGAARAQGIEIATRPGAQVVAPYDGKVVYAGPFRGYGRILIIEHGGRYHSLLAGLERIDAVVGQWLLAGEPVGVMAGADGAASSRNPKLYVELRRTGQPINPLPWLAQTGDKVRG
jgi:septal ring factor EnvC (AmiA/AmiB activator)